jgi:hypothetical protein
MSTKIIRHEADCRCALCRKVDDIIARDGRRRAAPGEPAEDYYVTDPQGLVAVWVPAFSGVVS